MHLHSIQIFCNTHQHRHLTEKMSSITIMPDPYSWTQTPHSILLLPFLLDLTGVHVQGIESSLPVFSQPKLNLAHRIHELQVNTGA